MIRERRVDKLATPLSLGGEREIRAVIFAEEDE